MTDRTVISEAAVMRYLTTLYSRLRAVEEASGAAEVLGNAFITAIPFSGPGERKLPTRSLEDALVHARRWDRDGWSVYICVNPVHPEARDRNKETVSWIVGAHSDLDLKDVTIDGYEALQLLGCLRHRPTMVVNSGNGLHVYLVLAEPLPATPENIARIERVNRRLAEVIGGDAGAHDVCRLLRLPGTHNRKHGACKPVTIVETTGSYHTLEELEEWLAEQPVLIERRAIEGAPRAAGGAARGLPRRQVELSPEDAANPYLLAAAEIEMSLPIDVEDRLARMTFQGAGETSIHQTQVECTASMLSSGMAIEDVVATILEATLQAAGAEGDRWDWRAEERALRNMCATWVRKNPELAATAMPNVASLQARRRTAAATNGIEDAEVLPLAGSPAPEGAEEPIAAAAGGGKVLDFGGAKPLARPRPSGKEKQHRELAEVLIRAMRDQGEDLVIMADQMWHYADGIWVMLPGDGSRWLGRQIEIAAEALGLKSDNRLINETRGYLMRSELFTSEVEWDAHGLIPTQSGLLDPTTLAVAPLGPEDRATWRVECEVDPEARCPWWLLMLEDAFADRSDEERALTLGLIQENLGMALVEDRPKALSKALVLQGGSDSGKTQLLTVLGGLLSARPISTTFDTLATPHGLMEFSRRAPWVLHEAFDQSKWHLSSTVKSILTGDPVQINIKGGPLVTQRVRAPVFWGTNHPPSFKEATKAIVNRLVVIPCRQTFDERRPTGVALEATRQGFSEPAEFILATEMPGLLNWALEGLRRARERGHFVLPEEALEARAAIRMDSNLVAGFVEECCEFLEDGMVATVDFGAAFEMWWRENKGENASSPSNDSIGRALAALGDARIGTERNKAQRYYLGLHLTSAGMDYWRAAASSTIAAGKTARISDEHEVNRGIPPSWDGKESVTRMRAGFANLRGVTDGVTDWVTDGVTHGGDRGR